MKYSSPASESVSGLSVILESYHAIEDITVGVVESIEAGTQQSGYFKVFNFEQFIADEGAVDLEFHSALLHNANE